MRFFLFEKGGNHKMQFFLPMKPPTVTHHAKELHAYMKGGKPCAVLHQALRRPA